MKMIVCGNNYHHSMLFAELSTNSKVPFSVEILFFHLNALKTIANLGLLFFSILIVQFFANATAVLSENI